MAYDNTQNLLKKRRGVSQIIGSLVVLAIVASIGSVILFQGLGQINSFNHDLSLHDSEHNEALREDVVFEHIRFDPNSNAIHLYLANVGSIDTEITSLTVVKIDTQEMVVAWSDDFIHETNENPEYILIEDHTNFYVNATLNEGTKKWNQNYYNSTEYKISLTTSKGNFFNTIAEPYHN